MDFLRAEIQPSPDLDKPIVIAYRRNVCRVVRKVGGTDWAGQFLLPMSNRRGLVCVVEREAGSSDKKLF